MQKARRQGTGPLRPLVSVWFQVLFTPVCPVLFTFPSRYSFTIGLSGVFSLAGWCRLLQTGRLLPRLTQDPFTVHLLYQYRTLTFFGPFSHRVLVDRYT